MIGPDAAPCLQWRYHHGRAPAAFIAGLMRRQLGCGTINVSRQSRESLRHSRASFTCRFRPASRMPRHCMKPIRKAVFPVAGLGTRFLPATKAMPKEMLPVVDRPLIQHVVDEAREAGIEHFIFVTGRNKGVIEDHFDRQFELEMTLHERKRARRSRSFWRSDLPGPGTASFTRQQLPLGLGHAVWCARELVGNEPFALLLPDVLVQHEPGCLAQMIDAYTRRSATTPNIIAVEEVPTRAHPHLRRGRRRQAQGQAVRDHRDGREAAAREGAVEPHHHRPLHPAAGNLRHPGDAGRAARAARSSSPTR